MNKIITKIAIGMVLVLGSIVAPQNTKAKDVEQQTVPTCCQSLKGTCDFEDGFTCKGRFVSVDPS